MNGNTTWNDMELLFKKIQFAKDIESKLVEQGRIQEADEIAYYADCFYPWDVVKEILDDKEGMVINAIPPISGKKYDYYFRTSDELITKKGGAIPYVFTSVDQDESLEKISKLLLLLKEKGYVFGKEKVLATNVKQISLDIAAPADWNGEKFIQELLEMYGLNVLGINQEDLTSEYKKQGGVDLLEDDGTFGEFTIKEPELKNKITVNTPVGDIAVSVKTDSEYPGVYVDLKGNKVNDTFEINTVSLATIEFDPNKGKVQSVVYGDAEKEEPTHIVEHDNVEKPFLKVDSLVKEAVTNEISHWLSKCDDELDMESDEYKSAVTIMKELCFHKFPELHDSLFGNSDDNLIFSTGDGEFVMYYYNPDSNVGGQIVECPFDVSGIQKLIAGEELMDVLAEKTQYLSDINSEHFFNTIFEMMDLKDEGCFLGTDIDVVCHNYMDSQNKETKSLDKRISRAASRNGIKTSDIQKNHDVPEL